jgi:TRAP-type C4-dicarboxylate transport system permease small subunit
MLCLLHLKRGISVAVRTILVIGLAFMCLSIAASVFIRNFFGHSFDTIIDINRIFFVWITFLGLVFINGEERLIRFELLENKLPKIARAVLHAIQRLAALVLYAVMVVAGIQVIPFAQPQLFPTMPVSLVWLYLPVVIAGVLLIVQTLATLLLSLKSDSAGKETPC